MRKVFFRFLNAPLLILILVIAVAIQTSLFTFYPLTFFKPDMVLVLVIWLGLRRGFEEGGILTLIAGEISEVHSSAPRGMYLISYLLVFFLVRMSHRILILTQPRSWFLFFISCSLFFKVVNGLVMALLGSTTTYAQNWLLFLVPSALVTSAFAVWTHPKLDRFDWVTFKNEKARHRLEDELVLDDDLSMGVK